MKTNIEKIDDINIIISGIVDKSIIEQKVSKLKEQAKKELKKDKTLDAKEIDKRLKELQANKLQREAQSLILQNFIESGMKKANIDQADILGQPNFKKYEERPNAIYIVVELSTTPEIDTTIEYLDIIPSYTIPKADPILVKSKLEALAKKHAPFTKIKQERTVKNGDLVIIDFEGFLNGRALEGGSGEKYALKVGSKSFMPGFEEQMIGMKPHEEKNVKVTFPQNYQAKALAGKETEFSVKLHEIQEQLAMDIDNALAQKVLSDETATIEILKDKITEQVRSQEFSNLYNATLKPHIIKELLTKFDFTLPNNAVEQEIDAKINAIAQGMSKDERAIYQNDKEKFQGLRDSVRTEARDSIKAALIIDALAKKENINVDEKEVVETLQQEATTMGKDPDEFVAYYKTNNLMTSATVRLTEEKLFSRMLEMTKSR